MEKDTKGSSNEKRISTERSNWALHHSWARGPSVANRTFSHNQDIEMEEMKDPMAPTAKEKKTGFYKLFGMSKRQWDQEIKWAQARKNKQRREMKTFKTFKDITEGFLSERVSASAQTKSKLQKPLTRTDSAALKLKVKNIISDLDSLAWKLENQIKFDDSKIHTVFPVVKHIDVIIKDIKVLDKELKKIL